MTVAEFAIPQTRRRDRRTALRWILAHAFGHPRVVAMVFVGAFGNAALAAAVPVLIGQAFSLLQDDPSRWPELLPLALMMAGTQLVRGLLQFGRNFGADLLGQRLERDIRDELYLSLLGKSMTFHNLQSVGDLMARATNDVREIGLMFNPGFNLVIGSANFLLLPLLVAPSYHPALIAVPALFILGYVLTLWQYLGELRPVSDQARRAFGRMNSHLSEAIDGIEVVKGHAQEEEEVGRFSVNAGAFRDAFVRQGDIEARFLPLLLLGLAEAGARRILELMQQEVSLDSSPAGHSARLRGEIEFRQVDFAHAPGEDTLHDLNLHIRPGQTVAVVGQTGSGKSSLVKLVNRIHDVTAGQVLLDGVDVRQWDLASLRSQISIIEQDVFLFSRTIAENIAFGKPGEAQPEVERAAREAQADEFIRGFAEGYRTMVGERGVTLSGGQRQRIALARAFLTDPRILILDDSTSSIDSATEDQIQRAIFRAAEG